MALVNVTQINGQFYVEEFDPKEWARFPDLREITEQELFMLREFKATNENYQKLLKSIHDRPEVDAEKHGEQS